jgi:hypothetical protein
LLDYYNIKLQHLNLNGIQHIVAFIMLCEGFLGIDPHFKLWRYFFVVSLHRRVEREKEKKREFKVPVGRASIHLWGNRAAQYMSLLLTMSNKGWHKQWFYLRNDPAAPPFDLLRQLHRIGTEDVGVGSPCQGAR